MVARWDPCLGIWGLFEFRGREEEKEDVGRWRVRGERRRRQPWQKIARFLNAKILLDAFCVTLLYICTRLTFRF